MLEYFLLLKKNVISTLQFFTGIVLLFLKLKTPQ